MPVPARRAALARALILAVGLSLTAALAACTTPTRPPVTTVPPPPSPTGRPVLLVGGTDEAVSVVNQTRSFLQARGYTAYSMQLLGTSIGHAGSVESGRAICERIDAILAETGAAQVDLAGHSQGSITGRWCIKSGGALTKVATFVSVGGVDSGTTTANFPCIGQGCVDMRHGSTFLRELNAGDTTPGDAAYFKIYSTPSGGGVEGEDAPIPGATNVSAQQLCPGNYLRHADQFRSVTVQSFLHDVFTGRVPTAVC
jgi:triacylglycerol lipase